jgi:hypothetical protein
VPAEMDLDVVQATGWNLALGSQQVRLRQSQPEAALQLVGGAARQHDQARDQSTGAGRDPHSPRPHLE